MKCGGLGALALLVSLVVGCGSSSSDTEQTEQPVSTEESAPAEETEAGDETGRDTDGVADEATSEGPGDDTDDETGDDADDGRSADGPEASSVVGTVISSDGGEPLADVVITSGDQTVTTGADGSFALVPGDSTELLVRRPTYLPVVIAVDDLAGQPAIALEPVVSRGVRVSREVAADPQRYQDLLTQIGPTTVNSLVFDTKDETGEVLYETDVAKAEQLDAVVALYEPQDLLADAIEAGLYPITRVVTFEDRIWSAGDAEAKLAGAWVDATNEDNWAYPLALAEEACHLGFAEIQFDYVRYPAGRTAEVAADRVPATSDERADVIASFLAEARSRLEPLGCGVSAAIFGIVMSSETDEGIGQTVEAVSAHLDAVSPMLYPSHYGPGWLGFADPNDHPGPVIADALDDGIPKLSEPIQMRPWIQAFYYNGAQIQAQMTEAEARGAGWLLWNASGRYSDDWLPAAQ